MIRSKHCFTHDTQYLLRIYAYLNSVYGTKTHFNSIYAYNLVTHITLDTHNFLYTHDTQDILRIYAMRILFTHDTREQILFPHDTQEQI